MTAPRAHKVKFLPTQFTLSIRYRDAWWTITSPENPGLYVAHQDLNVCLADVPLALTMLRRLNAESAPL